MRPLSVPARILFLSVAAALAALAAAYGSILLVDKLIRAVLK